MSKLDDLTTFVSTHLPPRVMQGFDSFMDEVSFIPARRDLGEDQYQLAVMKFDAVLSWERWPYRVCDPRNLCALLLVWQEGQDDVPYMDAGLDMELPTLDVDVRDQDSAIVVVSLQLAESLAIVADDNGIIPFDGRRWRLTSPEVWQATSGHLFGAGDDGAEVGAS
ncbi:hypothetical protein DZA65_00801 [Dickeya dianthicola]|uniref:Phage tail protein n=1 Tax=Dickeya dianthicola TaxID=204039 RepID=A0AAP6VIT5_9GAMM|nr:phage tail protein [Dickeya dianthicola]AYC17707.1 hypothetical protein DZA65_00801 [Dickeya dianthicola]MBI0436522.1 phage tail protein [Dickeya dianthicola]MBI0448248.1 phage tail protein [Dickeya dianthicola]MBI0452862.1 phage tail protein [Dickeya dianthicola]MBI0457356.1 phage tail protein [Dickeya dianthicola]